MSGLRDGVIPFWNPHQYAGAPFLADNQSGIFYPFNLLLFFLWPGFSYRGIEALVVWHFFFAGAAMYACLRLLRPPISRVRRRIRDRVVQPTCAAARSASW